MKKGLIIFECPVQVQNQVVVESGFSDENG